MADGFSWSLFNLPAEPPWHCDAAARLLPAVQTGTTRRPLINPPPKHIGACPAGLEFASEPAGNGEEQHREERTQVVTVYEDMAPYRMRNKWESADSGEKTNQASVPTLHFESRFESGNLQRAVKVGPTEYDLYLRPDKGGHVQWYYFMVRNMKNGVRYIFNIANLVKNKSLYNSGLRPLMYSDKDARTKHGAVGWHRVGSKCSYYQKGNRYSLTFSLTFKNAGDTCFLAHCYPYTYTDSQLFLSNLLRDPTRSKTCKRQELCRSLAGNVVDLLEISENVHAESFTARGKILLSARVHPGETQGSWAIQSCIEFLTSNLPEARLLRSRFTIYVVPMLNPDGVINGHYRCSNSGQDLNRMWADPDKTKHPCIWHIRDLVRILSSQGLHFFCDFHGHSVKKNAFMYGCCGPGNQSYKSTSAKAIPATAMFPLLLDEIAPAFSFDDCNFRVDRSKVKTGRVVVNREFGVANSYTMEISFLGYERGGSMVHFKIEDLQQIGRDFAIALIKYHLPTQYEMIKSAQSVPTSSLATCSITPGPDSPLERNCSSLEKATGFTSYLPVAESEDRQRISPVGLGGAQSSNGHAATVTCSASANGHKTYATGRTSALSASVAGTEWHDECQDNFIRACNNRREYIANEIRQCEAHLVDMSRSALFSKEPHISDSGHLQHCTHGHPAAVDHLWRSPTSLRDKNHDRAQVDDDSNEGEDDSECDSEDSSSNDDEAALDSGSAHADSDSNGAMMDASGTTMIVSAKAQCVFRGGASPTSRDLLQHFDARFLPKLGLKTCAASLDVRDPRLVFAGQRSVVGSPCQKLSPTIKMDYRRAAMTRYDAVSTAQHVSADDLSTSVTPNPVELLSVSSALKSSIDSAEVGSMVVNYERGAGVAKDRTLTVRDQVVSSESCPSLASCYTQGQGCYKDNVHGREESEEKEIELKGTRVSRKNLQADSAGSLHDTCSKSDTCNMASNVNAYSELHVANEKTAPLGSTCYFDQRLERRTQKPNGSTIRSLSKITHLCAAVESYHARDSADRPAHFPHISDSDSPNRQAWESKACHHRDSSGIMVMVGIVGGGTPPSSDAAPIVGLRFAEARSLDSSPHHAVRARFSNDTEHDLHRLPYRLGNLGDVDLSATSEVQSARSPLRYLQRSTFDHDSWGSCDCMHIPPHRDTLDEGLGDSLRRDWFQNSHGKQYKSGGRYTRDESTVTETKTGTLTKTDSQNSLILGSNDSGSRTRLIRVAKTRSRDLSNTVNHLGTPLSKSRRDENRDSTELLIEKWKKKGRAIFPSAKVAYSAWDNPQTGRLQTRRRSIQTAGGGQSGFVATPCVVRRMSEVSLPISTKEPNFIRMFKSEKHAIGERKTLLRVLKDDSAL